MNRKSNPWVALVALILLLVLTVCVGCDDTTTTVETDAPRFIVEEASVDSQGTTLYSRIAIITDTETGVQYIAFKGSNCAGLTKLEPAPEKETEG